jgi:hypothetical protein
MVQSERIKESRAMKAYEIEYMYNGKHHTVVEQPIRGWEPQFLQQVLNRIESLVDAGAVVTALKQI